MYASLLVASLLAAAPADAPGPSALPPTSSPPAPAVDAALPVDLLEDAKLLFRVVACGSDEPLPAGIDAAVVAAHCAELRPLLGSRRARIAAVDAPLLATLRPAELSGTVVYPFGGGDLATALTAFPDATEITTLSLEHAGDPRRLRALQPKALEKELRTIRPFLARLLETEDFSRSTNLKAMERGLLPGQLSFFLVALALHGFEPRGLRYVTLQPDGAVHALTAAEITALEKTQAVKLKKTWAAPNFSVAFANLELSFARPGEPADKARVHRHFAANLSNAGWKARPELGRYLDARVKPVAMTKAASYLLWLPDFTSIRDWLLGHVDFLLSDSSGVSPADAAKAGFVLETYGTFEAPYLPDARQDVGKELAKVFTSQPVRPLAFRFGYPDVRKRPHLVVTKRAGK